MDDVLARYETGAVVREDAFTSASDTTPFRGNIEFVMDSSQGRDLRMMDGAESEVLFQRGTEFLVGDREYDAHSDMWRIHLKDPPPA